MKFPRSAKVLGSQSNAAPYAAVFFLLVIFLLIGAFLPIPGIGIKLQPPAADDLPGIDQPGVAVAVDSNGRFFFANKMVSAAELKTNLVNALNEAHTPLMLVIHADKSVSYDQLMQLTLLAREAGITNALLATLPGLSNPANPP
jgi:biopolymer transport protein ExbD